MEENQGKEKTLDKEALCERLKILARLLLLTAISIFTFLLNPSEVFSWYCNVEII